MTLKLTAANLIRRTPFRFFLGSLLSTLRREPDGLVIVYSVFQVDPYSHNRFWQNLYSKPPS